MFVQQDLQYIQCSDVLRSVLGWSIVCAKQEQAGHGCETGQTDNGRTDEQYYFLVRALHFEFS